MLQTVEAIIEPSGVVRLLENVRITAPKRAIVTVLDTSDHPDRALEPGHSDVLLKFLAEHPLPPECQRSAEAIDAQIQAERVDSATLNSTQCAPPWSTTRPITAGPAIATTP
jgi:hypothetical protein